MVKSLPAVWETRVRSLGQEDPLEKGLATQSSILALKIPCTEEPGKLQSMGSQRVNDQYQVPFCVFVICISSMKQCLFRSFAYFFFPSWVVFSY